MLRNVPIVNTFLAISLSTLLCASDDVRRIIIESRVFMLMDGFELGYSNVHKAHVFIGKIQELLQGKKDHTGTHIGLIPFKEHKLSVKELAAIEKMHGNNPENTEHLHKALTKAIDIFESMSDEHLRETQGVNRDAIKEMTTELIEKWSVQRNLPHTILLAWSSVEDGQEKEHFRRVVISFAQLDNFLEDLKMFLKDFMHSCPKSFERYKTALLEARSREKTNPRHR